MNSEHMPVNTGSNTWRVSLLNGLNAGKCWRLSEGELVTVGRDPDCNIHLSEHGVSRLSCDLCVESGQLLLHNYRPKRTIRLNGQTLQSESKAELSDGDEVLVGGSDGVRLRVEREPLSHHEPPSKSESIGHGPTAVDTRETEVESSEVRRVSSDDVTKGDKRAQGRESVADDVTRVMQTTGAVEPMSRDEMPGLDDETQVLPPSSVHFGNDDEQDDKTRVLEFTSDGGKTEVMPPSGASYTGYPHGEYPLTRQMQYPDTPPPAWSRKNALWAAAVALFAMMIWAAKQGTKEDSKVPGEQGIAKVWVSARFRMEAKDNALVVNVEPGGSAGFALRSQQDPRIRWMAFEHWIPEEGNEADHGAELLSLMDPATKDFAHGLLQDMAPALRGLKWIPKTDGAPPSGAPVGAPRLMSGTDGSAWFIELEGLSSDGSVARRKALARLWLCGDHAVLAVIWRDPDDMYGAAVHELLNGVRIDAPPEFAFDRRASASRADVEPGKEEESVRSWLDTADEYWKTKNVDPANAWKGHQYARKAWTYAVMNPTRLDLQMDRIWDVVTKTANDVQKEFLRLKFEAETASHLGRSQDAVAACENIQMRIPQRTDFRWLWAEGMRVKSKPESKGGLF